MPTEPLKIQEAQELAKVAIKHVLNALADDPRKYYLMGRGTESFAKLTAAAAALWDTPVEKVQEAFAPPPDKWNRYVAQLEADEKLLNHCREKGITVPKD